MKRFSLSGLFLLLLLSVVFLSYRYTGHSGKFRIDPSSKLRLEGATNINQFTCDCQENFPVDTYYANEGAHAYLLRLEKTELKLRIQNLDCGRAAINKDLRKALQADEHPYIRIEVETIRLPEPEDAINSEKWTNIPVKTRITIAGVSRPLHLSVDAKAIGKNIYHLRSKTQVAMTDFGIDPPKPMLGMIKVKDEITIDFDLKVSI
ncbi:MAG: YceI family protein [Saprospiraceae bacterium]|nr:YceI family protein [Lewinella sp.]